MTTQRRAIRNKRSRDRRERRRNWVRSCALATLAAAPAGPAAAGISGLCPDGSIYIVQRESQIPCPDSKQVAPHEIPPIRPELLPTPYTWKVWNERQDPNNPYNLIDAARQVRGLDGPGGAPPPGVAGAPPSEQVAALPQSGPAAPTLPSRPLDLGLSGDELRSLYQIVELTQESIPVQFARNTADGRGVFRVALARSGAFESRLRDAWESRGGLGGATVVLFTAVSKQPFAFHGNFTFVQEHMTYQPDATNARQLGVLQGRLGNLEGGEAVLGYIVLPETMDPALALDVYWNDRMTVARFGG